MVTWIVIGVFLLSLLVLALAVRPVLVRLAGLRRAAMLAMRRQAEVEALQASAMSLQDRVLALQSEAERAQHRAAEWSARRASA